MKEIWRHKQMSKTYQISEEELLELCEKAAFADFCFNYANNEIFDEDYFREFAEDYFKDKNDIPNNIKEAIINNPEIAVEDIGYFKMLEYIKRGV